MANIAFFNERPLSHFNYNLIIVKNSNLCPSFFVQLSSCVAPKEPGSQSENIQVYQVVCHSYRSSNAWTYCFYALLFLFFVLPVEMPVQHPDQLVVLYSLFQWPELSTLEKHGRISYSAENP